MTAQTSFEALGTTAVVAATDPERLPQAVAAVREAVDELDRACSSFRADSELARLNAAAGSPVTVGPLLLDAVAAALRAAVLTEGDVDPTVGEALIALGYGPRSSASTSAIARVPGWRVVELDRDAGTISIPRGVMLDLGATAKALGADRAAARAFEAAGCGVLVSLGGDLAIAGDAPEGGWSVRVTDDHRAGPEAPGQSITLQTGGLATSSTTVRRSGDVHHLIDPASARPTSGPWRTASVAAASCLDANIASTAAIVRGDRAVAWLETLGLPSRLVSLTGGVVHLAGWPSDGEELLAA